MLAAKDLLTGINDIKIVRHTQGRHCRPDIDNGDYIKVRSVDFSNGAKSFEASVASASGGGNIEIRLDNLTGTLLGVCPVKDTGGWQKWVIQSCKVGKEKGIHDVYFVFKGDNNELFNFDWWKFNAK